jgi:inosine/xanthosine triphosphatase
MKKVIVGSTNPVKIAATKQAFEKMFPNEDFEVEGISVSSGVSDQPMNEKEFLQGAKNRADAVRRERPDADYWVGLEGGVEDTENGMECWAWMVIKSETQTGIGSTGKFILPPKSAELIHQGMELGHATDFLHDKTNSKHGSGTTGVLTNNVLDRTDYYIHGLLLALIPFINEQYYS